MKPTTVILAVEKKLCIKVFEGRFKGSFFDYVLASTKTIITKQ